MITLKVDGMTCEHCVAAVSRALAQVPGVERVVEVSLERGEAIVEGHPDAGQAIAAVVDEGYAARIVSDQREAGAPAGAG
jgi:copper chaperone